MFPSRSLTRQRAGCLLTSRVHDSVVQVLFSCQGWFLRWTASLNIKINSEYVLLYIQIINRLLVSGFYFKSEQRKINFRPDLPILQSHRPVYISTDRVSPRCLLIFPLLLFDFRHTSQGVNDFFCQYVFLKFYLGEMFGPLPCGSVRITQPLAGGYFGT